MSDVATVPAVWERQQGEPEEAWIAFRCYRDMPPDERQIKRAAAVQLSMLSSWFRTWNWEERCRAYDAHFDKMRIEERERVYRRTAREVAIDHMVMLADARELMTREFAKLLSASRDSEAIGLMKPRDLVRMAEVMVKLDRLVRGETTENIGTTEMDLSNLSPDELRTLNELMTKAEKTRDDTPESPELDS